MRVQELFNDIVASVAGVVEMRRLRKQLTAQERKQLYKMLATHFGETTIFDNQTSKGEVP